MFGISIYYSSYAADIIVADYIMRFSFSLKNKYLRKWNIYEEAQMSQVIILVEKC